MRSLALLFIAPFALSGCAITDSQKTEQAIGDIEAGVAANYPLKLGAAADQLKDVSMNLALDHDAKGPQECYIMHQDALHIYSSGAQWYAEWLASKSEATARKLWNPDTWFKEGFHQEPGACGEPATEQLRQKSLAFLAKAKPAVLAVYPNLEKTIIAENTAAFEKRKAAEGTPELRWARCTPSSDDMQSAFDQFVRLEDRNGKDNETHEAIVAEVFGTTSDCIHRTMVRALEMGMQPPEL